MCGVIGYMPIEEASGRSEAFGNLMRESRIRGMHAYGIYQRECLHSTVLEQIIAAFDPNYPAVAHCRYSTSGDWQELKNAQPILVDDVALVFNGVISMKTKEEYEAEFNIKCNVDNDGEIFLRQELCSDAEFIRDMKGSFAGCILENGTLYVGRNARRPLWKCWYLEAWWYASTADIFKRADFPQPTEVPIGVESCERKRKIPLAI